MFARKIGLAWEVFAPAKLNLYLEILGRRTDGFHELETLMAPISLYDRLEWSPAGPADPPGFSLGYDGSTPREIRAAAPADRDNLVWRAVDLLAQTAGVPPTGRITLTKRIPVQSGLGGGSSDAAAALVLANGAWGLAYPKSRLAELAARLGSDAPFFLHGGSAVCRGRGERIEPAPHLPRLHVVVAKPPVGIATAASFRAFDAQVALPLEPHESSRRVAELLARLRSGSLARAGQWMSNRLEAVAAELCPWIEPLRLAFARAGALGRLMTGSGSAYFGVMRSARQAQVVARRLASRQLGTVFVAASCR